LSDVRLKFLNFGLDRVLAFLVVDLETLSFYREKLFLNLFHYLVLKIFQILTNRFLFEEIKACFPKLLMSLFEHFVIFAVGFLHV
jgi:hypothetical protein